MDNVTKEDFVAWLDVAVSSRCERFARDRQQDDPTNEEIGKIIEDITSDYDLGSETGRCHFFYDTFSGVVYDRVDELFNDILTNRKNYYEFVVTYQVSVRVTALGNDEESAKKAVETHLATQDLAECGVCNTNAFVSAKFINAIPTIGKVDDYYAKSKTIRLGKEC